MNLWHRKLIVSVLMPLAATGLSGCLSIADRAVTEELKSVEHEFQVFQADAALFRQCLQQRGGACSGDAATPMPHSSQANAGQQVSPMTAGSGMLSEALAKLPPQDPTRAAGTMLHHPVIRQAMALHDHLRGLPVGDVEGVSVDRSRGISGIKHSVFTLHMKLDQIVHFHDLLLESIGTTAWESLLGQCAALLERHRGEPQFSALQADCRTAAFIRGYLNAYFRRGEFLQVDVKLAGAIQALDNGAARIKQKIATIQTGISSLETDSGSAVTGVGSAAEDVGTEVQDLISKLEADISNNFGPGAAAKFAKLADLGDQVGSQSGKLQQGAGDTAANKILLSDIEVLLMKIDHELTALAAIVNDVDQKLVGDINAGLLDADKALSNIFKVSTVGFVSRDITFQARLPTLEVTFDPTAKRLVTLTDVDSGQIISGKSDLNLLGVVNDQSGVGTGAAIGAEVVRVFLEAIFDAHEGLPALAPVGQSPKATGLALGEYSLPLFSSPMGNIDARDLSHITHFNDSVAAGTRVISGRIISGIGPLSLNNQPLEDLIVEILATAVRKSAEKASWCWYACNLDVDAKALKTDADKTVDAAATSVTDKLRAEAERVRLRLKLSK